MSSKDDDIDVTIDADEWLEKQREKGRDIVRPTQGMETDDGLVPLELEEALKKHHEIQRANDRAESTIDTHNRKIPQFLAWLRAVAGVETTADIEPRHFRDYRTQLEQDYKKVTVKSEMTRISAFIRNLASVQAVPEGYSEYVEAPSLKGKEGQQSDHLPVARGDRLLGYLRSYEWGSMSHVFYELMWAGALRLGSIHSLDEDDVDFENGGVHLKHRPERGTTLKNKESGERFVSLRPETLDAIRDYLDHPGRPDVEDDDDRKPLLVTGRGRPSKSHLRNICYQMTTPCFSQQGCPYSAEKLEREVEDEDYAALSGDPEDCRARNVKNQSSKCPGSKAPHAIRSGALTRQMKRGVPPTVLSERANVGVDTLENHYLELSKEERASLRREWFDDEYEVSGEEAEKKMFGRTSDDRGADGSDA